MQKFLIFLLLYSEFQNLKIMKKIISGIFLISLILFVFPFNINANIIKQNKPKVAIQKKVVKVDDHKCCADTKKTDVKCCKGDAKKDVKCNHDKTKQATKCNIKSDCSKKCTDKKNTEPKL